MSSKSEMIISKRRRDFCRDVASEDKSSPKTKMTPGVLADRRSRRRSHSDCSSSSTESLACLLKKWCRVFDGHDRGTVSSRQRGHKASHLHDGGSSSSVWTLSVEGHRYPCRPGESRQTRCLNAGRCFVIHLHDGLRRAGCSCPSSWIGDRCEQKYIDPHQFITRVHTAGMNEGTSALIFVALFLLLVVHFVLGRRRRTSEPLIVQKSSAYQEDVPMVSGDQASLDVQTIHLRRHEDDTTETKSKPSQSSAEIGTEGCKAFSHSPVDASEAWKYGLIFSSVSGGNSANKFTKVVLADLKKTDQYADQMKHV